MISSLLEFQLECFFFWDWVVFQEQLKYAIVFFRFCFIFHDLFSFFYFLCFLLFCYFFSFLPTRYDLIPRIVVPKGVQYVAYTFHTLELTYAYSLKCIMVGPTYVLDPYVTVPSMTSIPHSSYEGPYVLDYSPSSHPALAYIGDLFGMYSALGGSPLVFSLWSLVWLY